MNLDWEATGEERKSPLSELEESRAKAFENLRMHKERSKLFHDRNIYRKKFFPGKKVLLFYDFRLHLFLRKLRLHWTGPFIIFHVFPYDAIEIQNPTGGTHFKVNRKRLKPFLKLLIEEREAECLILYEP